MVCNLANTTERRQREVCLHAEVVVLVRDPIEAGHTVHLVLGIATDENIVAAFSDELIESTAADEDIVAGYIVFQTWIEVIAGRAVLGSLFDPVVAFAAHLLFIDFGAQNKVVALPGKNFRNVFDADNKVLAGSAENEIDTRGRRIADVDDVVAVTTLQIVVTAYVRDNVITGSTEQNVIAEAAFEPVATRITVKRVVADAGNDDVVTGRTTEHDVVLSGILEVIAIRTQRRRIVADHYRRYFHAVDGDPSRGIVRSCRIGAAIRAKAGMLCGLINLKRPSGNLEDLIGQMGHIGVGHHQF